MGRGGSYYLVILTVDRYLCMTRSGCGEAMVCWFSRWEKAVGRGRKVVYASSCLIWYS